MFDSTPIEGMRYVADWYSGGRKYCPDWIDCVFQVRRGFSAKRVEIYMFKLWGYFGSVVAGFMNGFVATLSIPPKSYSCHIPESKPPDCPASIA